MKKKILTVALAACLLVLSIAGSSIAYFTDTDAKSTTFTMGDVDIALTYASIETTKLFPSQTYANPAVIENIGDDEAYVGAVITISGANIENVLDDTSASGNIPVAVESFLQGLNANKIKNVDGDIVIYVIMSDALAAGQTATIFSALNIPAEWTKDEMEIFVGSTITVTAYATQVPGFANAEAALTTAFKNLSTPWDNYAD